jgi:hypothetical protein
MTSGLTDRRAFAEQRLFEVQVEIARVENEVELIEVQLGDLDRHAQLAAARLVAAETPVADVARSAARGRLAQMQVAAEVARERLASLRVARDDLLAKLVG